MKLGVSTRIFGFYPWIREVGNLDFDCLEINRRTNNLPFYPEWIATIKPLLKSFDLSFHTGTCRVFTGNSQFDSVEIEMLKAEVLLAQIVGAKQVVFHLADHKLSDEQAGKLEQVLDLARKHNIEMCYESNGRFSAEVCLDTLGRFPCLSYCLDLGHLNVSVGQKKLGMDLDEFLSRIKGRTTYVHAHNNYGEHDEHLALRNGSLGWKYVLKSLSNVKKVIVECHNAEEALLCREDLMAFFR